MGKINAGSLIQVVIMMVVLFTILATTVGDVGTAGDLVNATGAPLAGLFSSGGVMILLLMAGVVLCIMGMLGFGGKR